MKTAFSVFLVSFVALGASWYGFVYGPLRQLGEERQSAVLQSQDAWPPYRTGDATLGLQVYRQYGCAACHTEQIRQSGVANELALTSLGNHKPEDFREFLKSLMLVPELTDYSNNVISRLDHWNGSVPLTLYFGENDSPVSILAEKLKPAGVKTESRVVPTGTDISRGWGVRQSVAADYLYDQPIQLGNLRAGPDLGAIGVRQPDVRWQLLHLYAPKAVVPNSTMPPFRSLFEKRPLVGQPSPDRLALTKEFGPGDGYEIIPTPAARQLAAYLLSLKANVPLYEAPFTPATAANK